MSRNKELGFRTRTSEMTFKPGESGNPGGLRRHKEFADALRMELAALDQGDHRGMRKVAASLIREALKGNIAAVKEIADRTDGRVPQAQIIQGDDDGLGPIRLFVAVPMQSASSEQWLEDIGMGHMCERALKLIDTVVCDDAE
jgi:hypothetical protein